MLLFRLPPEKIPTFWEPIKVSVKNSNENIKADDLPVYFSNLLYELMSDRACVFVYLTDKKELVTVQTWRFTVDKDTDRKIATSDSIYAFRQMTDDDWAYMGGQVIEYMKSRGIDRIQCLTRNQRVIDMSKMLGAKEGPVIIFLDLGDI